MSGSMSNYLEKSKVIHISPYYEYKHRNTIFLSELSGMIRVFVDKNDEQKQNCSSDTVQPIPTKQ